MLNTGSTATGCVLSLLPPPCPLSRFPSLPLGADVREDVSRHRPIAARARKSPFFLVLSFLKKKEMHFYFLGRWIHISRRSTRDRRPSTSRAACRLTSRLAYATGYAPALLVRCSSRTRLSLAKAERGTIGRKAVRLFPFLPLITTHFCTVFLLATVYTDGKLILHCRLVNSRVTHFSRC